MDHFPALWEKELRHRANQHCCRHRTDPERAAKQDTGNNQRQVANNPHHTKRCMEVPVQFIGQDNGNQIVGTRSRIALDHHRHTKT